MFSGFRSQSQPEDASPQQGDRITVATAPEGFPQLGAFIAGNESYLIFRRFKYLQARLLIHMQDQLRVCEEELAALEVPITGVKMHSRVDDEKHSGRRKELMEEIEERYEKYISLLSRASSLASRADPTTTDYHNLRTFFRNYTPLVESEVYCGDKDKRDLVALGPKGDTTEIDELLGRFLQRDPCRLIQ
ncbi:hypothetical protein MGN70_013523, partial [Eutypa lata]